jgi:hypothetical protein
MKIIAAHFTTEAGTHENARTARLYVAMHGCFPEAGPRYLWGLAPHAISVWLHSFKFASMVQRPTVEEFSVCTVPLSKHKLFII